MVMDIQKAYGNCAAAYPWVAKPQFPLRKNYKAKTTHSICSSLHIKLHSEFQWYGEKRLECHIHKVTNQPIGHP